MWRSISLVFLFFTPLFVTGGLVQKDGLAVPVKYQAFKNDVGNMFSQSYSAYKLRVALQPFAWMSLNNSFFCFCFPIEPTPSDTII